MAIRRFPNPRNSTPEGIIAVGGDLEPESLLLAYSQGIFPWPIEGMPMAWFCPPERAILEWENLHIPRSLARARNKSTFRFTIDQAFSQVIEHCSLAYRPGQNGTWITPELKTAFIDFHRLGHAHSVEVWNQDNLIGGIYGVDGGGIFAGESMFHLEPNASKLAILYLLEYLHEKGLSWFDIQVMTPHMEALGARVISRNKFLIKLKETRTLHLQLFAK
jgi:leucyl/phenylalanyl-tRNA--protein transferase